MLNLSLTTDKLQVITDSTCNTDVHVSYADLTTSSGAVTPDKQNTNITTAATTDILASPASGVVRNAKTINIRNKHATSTVVVTVQFNANSTLYELHKATLAPGEALEYVEGVGFFTLSAAKTMDAKLRVVSDVINATTSFADVTGLTIAMRNGVFYNWLCHLYHVTNATTTGAQFGYNIGAAPTVSRLSIISTVTGSATAAVLSAPVGDVTARDTAVSVQTTGAANVVLSIMSGVIQPSADGTFAIRCASEVAVAAGLTVKAGSWLRVWQTDN